MGVDETQAQAESRQQFDLGRDFYGSCFDNCIVRSNHVLLRFFLCQMRSSMGAFIIRRDISWIILPNITCIASSYFLLSTSSYYAPNRSDLNLHASTIHLHHFSHESLYRLLLVRDIISMLTSSHLVRLYQLQLLHSSLQPYCCLQTL